MSALNEYLQQFYDNPMGLEEYKINFLKNHYFDIVKKVFKEKYDKEILKTLDFLIGVTRNRNLIYFKVNDKSSIHIIFNRNLNIFIE